MSRVIRLLYSVLDPKRTMTTDEAKAEWLKKSILDMDDKLVPHIYGMCTAYAHVCDDNDVFKELCAGYEGSNDELRTTLLSSIGISLKAKDRRCTFHCAKCKTGLDFITDTMVQDRPTGKIFCVSCRFEKR